MRQSKRRALFQSFFLGVEGQQLLVDNFAIAPSMRNQGEAGRQPLSALKLLKSDPAAVLAQSEDIKARYAKLSRCDLCSQKRVELFRSRAIGTVLLNITLFQKIPTYC